MPLTRAEGLSRAAEQLRGPCSCCQGSAYRSRSTGSRKDLGRFQEGSRSAAAKEALK